MTELATKIIESLTQARDLLARPGGYVRGTLYDNHGGYCAMGAVEHVAPVIDGKHVLSECAPVMVALESAIPADWRKSFKEGTVIDQSHRKAPTTRLSNIACYNNNTDQATVVNWFDRAIQMQREHPMESTK